MTAQQKAYQAERASATAVANATQLQKEVLRLSNQLDALREASEAQSSIVESQQVLTRTKTLFVAQTHSCLHQTCWMSNKSQTGKSCT